MRKTSIVLGAALLAACSAQPSLGPVHPAGKAAQVAQASVGPGDPHFVDRATTPSDYCVGCHAWADGPNNHPVRLSLPVAAAGGGYAYPPASPAIVLREGVWVECSSCHDDGSAGFPRRTVLADTCSACHDKSSAANPPYTSLTSPASGATVSGAIAVTATVSADALRVELWGGPSPDETTLLATAAPLAGGVSFPVDTTALPDGPYTFLVRAYAATGANDSSYASVVVSNPPAPPVELAIRSPAPSALLRGTIAVLATTANAARAELWRLGDVGDAVLVSSAAVQPDGSVSLPLDTTAWPDGGALLTVVAYAADGRSQQTSVATTADNTLPAVALTAPVAGAAIRSTTSLVATASDVSGIARVDFLVDGAPFGTATAAPYSVEWTPPRRSGWHTLAAIAVDAAGNSATTATVTVQAK